MEVDKVEIDNTYLSQVPFDAVNVSLRLKLSNMLNPELPFFERDGCARDYRGLAELMGFNNNDIMNFQRQKSPTMEILLAWSRNHTVLDFLQILERMQRYDVIDDLMPSIVSDCNTYYRNKPASAPPIQDHEVSSCSGNDVFLPANPNYLTIYDTDDKLEMFDAYICYANSDIKFVKWLLGILESPSNNIKLCLRDRDLPFGTLEYDNFVRLIHERCHRILIVLSPEFLESPECEYQAKYAASLVSEHAKSRRLIPIVYKPCDIPAVLKYLSKVDFSRVDIQEWIWKKLIASIKTPMSKLFVPQGSESQSSAEPCPFISEPSSSSSYLLPDVPSDEISLEHPSSSMAETLYPPLANVEGQLIEGSKSKRQKIVQKIKSFMTSSSSSGSSGFHSQSDA